MVGAYDGEDGRDERSGLDVGDEGVLHDGPLVPGDAQRLHGTRHGARRAGVRVDGTGAGQTRRPRPPARLLLLLELALHLLDRLRNNQPHHEPSCYTVVSLAMTSFTFYWVLPSFSSTCCPSTTIPGSWMFLTKTFCSFISCFCFYLLFHSPLLLCHFLPYSIALFYYLAYCSSQFLDDKKVR